MSSRDAILQRLRDNRPVGSFALPELPRFPLAQSEGLVLTFCKSLVAMGGKLFPRQEGENQLEALQERLAASAVVCSATPEVTGNRDLGRVVSPRDLADVDVAVVRAILGVAETGSVLLTDAELKINTLAYLAQELVVLLDPSSILSGLQAAYDHPAFRLARYAVFHTGPSATGDIEGVLIHGAQGVRSLTVVLVEQL